MGYRKILSYVTVVLFLLLAALPTYGMLIPALNRDTGENRALAQWPDKPEPALIEDWYDDHFALRGDMTAIYNLVNAKSGVEILNGVAIGKDGWLFYVYDGSEEDMRREIHYSQEELDAICSAQQATSDYLESRGISYYLLICPDKHTVYPEYLPDGLSGYEGESRFDGMYRALIENTDVNVIDTRAAVIEGKANERVFFKTDTHWNAKGAFIGYTELMERIAQDHPNVRIITEDDVTLTVDENWLGGDMSGFIGQSETMPDTMYSYTVKDSTLVLLDTPYPETSDDPERPVLRYENPDHPELPSAVVFRDSFVARDSTCLLMLPMLADSFSRVSVVWSTSVLNHIVEYEQPDIVIMEYVERYSGQAVQGMNIPESKLVDYESGDIALPGEVFSISSCVDSFSDESDICVVNGWAWMPDRDAVRGEKHVALRNGDEIVWCDTTDMTRTDVTAYFADVTGGLNLDASGFSATFDRSKLTPGKWELIIVIDDGNGSAGFCELGKRVRISE